jgi:glycosyltransferase involved in cell wall biosynthesis
MKILHLGRNSANQAGYAVKALRRLGHEAELWEYGPDDFGYGPDRTIALDTKDPLIFWRTFSEAIERFDVINFHAARSFFPGEWGGVPAYWDLPILRALGKKVFHTFHGSDCRIKRIHMENNPWSYYRYSDIRADDDRTEKIIQIFRTYANKLFVTAPDYLSFVPDAEVIGRIIDLDYWPEQSPVQRDIPHILHVPSRRGTKGTDMILEGIERLRAEGLAFEFSLLEGVSHDEARTAIQRADVVIDNLITGDYELVSIETMASNRVALAYRLTPSLVTFPDAPVFNIDPDTFVDRLGGLIRDRDMRVSLAARGREYVAKHHEAMGVARKLVEFYERPDTTVPQRTFPDWASIAYTRKIETLEQRVATLEQSLARARLGERLLRGRVAQAPIAGLKGWIPEPMRIRLRRLKARAKKAVPSGIRRRIIERRDRRFEERVRAQDPVDRPR